MAGLASYWSPARGRLGPGKVACAALDRPGARRVCLPIFPGIIHPARAGWLAGRCSCLQVDTAEFEEHDEMEGDSDGELWTSDEDI